MLGQLDFALFCLNVVLGWPDLVLVFVLSQLGFVIGGLDYRQCFASLIVRSTDLFLFACARKDRRKEQKEINILKHAKIQKLQREPNAKGIQTKKSVQ